MRIIAHRGNIYGSNKETENSPEQIDLCISKGYDVEVDLWNIFGNLYLGHDEPRYPVTKDWLLERKNNLWVHCKDIEALNLIKNDLNAFGHDKDDFVLTSNKNIWVYPHRKLLKGSVAVMPEICKYQLEELKECYAVCTDYSERYQNMLITKRKSFIYYHIAQMGEWKEVVADQVKHIIDSGLYDQVDSINVGVLGNEEIQLPEKFVIVYKSSDISEAEIPTLNKLHEHSFGEDFDALYIHTKGVSWKEQRKSKENLAGWRKYMEYFTVSKWKDCLKYLEEFDACGVQWFDRSDCFNGHFSGNFWWSKSEYIKTLPKVVDTILYPPHTAWPRIKAEFWLGSHDNIKIKNMFNYPINLYNEEAKLEFYKDE